MSDADASKIANDLTLEFNAQLDATPYAASFKETGRVHIPNLLSETSAQRLSEALERETPWRLYFTDGKRVRELAAASDEDQRTLAMAAWKRAHSEFQFFCRNYRLLEGDKTYPEPDHYLHKLVGFLRSARFISFIREVTGLNSIFKIDATATLYAPLDFLTVHDDDDPGGKRLVAYVLNMTPYWRPDWGGALQFFGRRGHIEEGYLPTFNALNLFRVPMRHSVSQVATFGGQRYSISGWFESKEANRRTKREPESAR